MFTNRTQTTLIEPSPHAEVRGKRRLRLRRAVSVVACLATFSVTAGVATVVAEPETTSGCPRWTAVLVPGTTETSMTADPSQLVGLLAPIGEGLRARFGDDIDVRSLPYSAAPLPYSASESVGVQALSSMLGGLCDSTQVVMAGYSQGADVAGDLASQIGNGKGPIPASRVLGVGLLSDPNRDPSTPQLGQAVSGQGIAGTRDSFAELEGRVVTSCASGDIYCSTSPEASPALSAVGRAFTGESTLDTDNSNSTNTEDESSGGLDASSVTQQVVIVLGGLASFAANIPQIGNDIAQLPSLLAVGDVAGVHRVAGELNTLFNPLVSLADKVDFHLVADALSLASAFDASGWTGIAAQIVDILADLDISRIATGIGTAQEVAWRAFEKLAVVDLIGAATELTGLIPVAADLAATAASALTGNSSEITTLAQEFTGSTDETTTTALVDLASQAAEAAQFATSGVHVNGYTDGALDLVGDWLADQIASSR